MTQKNRPLLKSKPLAASDAAAGLILVDDRRYLMQLRDDKPDIFYPGHWGLFGGSIDEGESLIEGLRRELREEIEFEFGEAAYFTSFDIDFSFCGLGLYKRRYYVIDTTAETVSRLRLHEGQDMRAVTFEESLRLDKVAPYDAFAVWLHANRDCIGKARAQ